MSKNKLWALVYDNDESWDDHKRLIVAVYDDIKLCERDFNAVTEPDSNRLIRTADAYISDYEFPYLEIEEISFNQLPDNFRKNYQS